MKLAIDIECNALHNPTKIWLVVCKDIDTGEYHVFRRVTECEETKRRLIPLLEEADLVVAHNALGYDLDILHKLLGVRICIDKVIDTLVISKLVDYPRQGHSIEDYGLEFGLEKGVFNDWSKYSPEMETYCIRDVDICCLIYAKYLRYINNPDHRRAIDLEQRFQIVCNELTENGFAFNKEKADKLLEKVKAELSVLDKEIHDAFPERLRLIREIHPTVTSFGSLHKKDFRWVAGGDLTEFNGGSFCRCSWEPFNPSSHKQIIAELHQAGWRPVDKTKTHIDTEREYKKTKNKDLLVKLDSLKHSGWKINEQNLETLPANAPKPARLLAKRIMLEARRRTLTEWLDLVWHEIELEHDLNGTVGIDESGKLIQSLEIDSAPKINDGVKTISKNQEPYTEETISNFNTVCPSKTLKEWLKTNKVVVQSVKKNANSTSIIVIGQAQLENFCAAIATAISVGTKNYPLKYKIMSQRIHGRFNGLGAWSHRMNHQHPNTANIPNEFDTQGKKKLLGKELRSLWIAPRNRLLVGCDAEGIQLRIFAHYINDPEFTHALVSGKKSDKTDPHSLNQRILGDVCRSRSAAKRFIYALLLGAGLQKLSEILVCEERDTKEALDRLLSRYQGWEELRTKVFPKDAKRGFFIGLDGRKVRIPGDTEGNRKHLAMSGYLQCGEAVCMKLATLKFYPELKRLDSKLVNFVHDEWQTETPNDMKIALEVAELKANALKIAGEELGLKCPLAGSYYNDDLHDYTIGLNWSVTH